MPIAKIDRIDDIGCDEVHGVIRSLTRKARILFEEADNPPNNFHILTAALDACPPPFSTPPTLAFGDVDIPAPNQQSFLTATAHRYGSLVLTKRTPKVADDPWCVDVTLHYEHVLDGPNQSVTTPVSGILVGKGKTSVVDKATNFYYPDGDTTFGRQQIAVAHTFPEHDKGIAGLNIDPTLPRTILQGGQINIPFPQSNFSFQGYWEGLRDPVGTSFKIVASINKNPWMGRPELTWLCSEMQWEAIELSKFRYRVAFEFQYNVDTWDATVVFTDQRTGRPPADVAKATDADPVLFNTGPGIVVINKVMHPVNGNIMPAGMWQVPALARIDFDQFFGAFFNGSNPSVPS